MEVPKMAGNNLRFWEKIVLFLRRVMGCNSGGDQGTKKPEVPAEPGSEDQAGGDNELTPQKPPAPEPPPVNDRPEQLPEEEEPVKAEPKNGEPLPRKPSPQPAEVVGGRGMWIWRWVQAEDGNLDRVIARARSAGLQWITIKGGDGLSWWSQLTLNLVRELQQAGFKVLGWVYAYGNSPQNEAAVANHVLDLGCDGLIIDAEAEYEGKPLMAEAYMKAIRAAHPGAFIAYSSFPLISKHPKFPYIEFGRYCDASMPQCYWKLIGFSPKVMMNRTKQEWDDWGAKMKVNGFGDSVVPLVPVGQGFNVSPVEIREFVKFSRDYVGCSLSNWFEMKPETWLAFAEEPAEAKTEEPEAASLSGGGEEPAGEQEEALEEMDQEVKEVVNEEEINEEIPAD